MAFALVLFAIATAGLVATDHPAIEAAQLAAGLPPAKKSALANGDYGLGHSSFVLAYTKDNLAHLIYPDGMSQQDWAHDLHESEAEAKQAAIELAQARLHQEGHESRPKLKTVEWHSYPRHGRGMGGAHPGRFR